MEILKKVQQFDQKSYNPKYAYFYTKITKKLEYEQNLMKKLLFLQNASIIA